MRQPRGLFTPSRSPGVGCVASGTGAGMEGRGREAEGGGVERTTAPSSTHPGILGVVVSLRTGAPPPPPWAKSGALVFWFGQTQERDSL